MTESRIEKQALSRNTRRILGITVLLAQFPLALHLPLWISIPGMLLVLSKVVPTFDRRNFLPPLVMTPLVLIAAAAIIFHYGHFFDRDPCVAFLFLLVGFKFAESRRIYDASLLIILSAFLLLTQFFYWQSIAAAILSIPAIFFIGLSLFSLQRGASELDMRTMVNLTSKLLLQAIPIAMLLFVLVPRITTSGWGNANGDGNSVTGLSSRMSPGSIANLSKSNEPAFRVEFDAQVPSPRDLYWRGPVLTGFDGYDWYVLPSRVSNYLPQTNYGQSDTNVSYTVTMEPTRNPWLPALDTPVILPQQEQRSGETETIARINNERQLNSLKPLDRITRYRASSNLTDTFTPTMSPGAENLLTTESNPKAREWANKLRLQYSDDETLANEILHWFNEQNFFYTLEPPRLGRNSIDDFLFDSRRGFCEHYSGSFVFLLRAAGIPARVVTGYQGGEFNGSYMIVRQSDAHAWSEAFINGQWRRFDPTAAVAPARVEQGINEALRAERSNNFLNRLEPSWFKTAQLKWDSVNYAWQQLVVGFDSGSQNALWNKLGFNRPSALVIVLILIAAGLIWLALILFPLNLAGQKKPDPCEIQWSKFCNKFDRHGMSRNTGESAQSYAGRLIQRWPNHREQIGKLLRAYQAGRYSKPGQQRKTHLQHASEMKTALKQLVV